MKKIIALLCALLLLAVSCACADSPVVDFNNVIRIDGKLPAGYSFSLNSTPSDISLEGTAASEDPAVPSLAVCIAFNESYAGYENLKALDENSLNLVKASFTEEYSVSFEMLDTSAGDTLLVVRENNAQFVDFYTVCLGYEIDLTLVPADGKTLTDAQINSFLEFIRNMDIVPVKE